jgi:hypothetical protein
LGTSNKSRTFFTQTHLKPLSPRNQKKLDVSQSKLGAYKSPQFVVRTQSTQRDGTIQAFLQFPEFGKELYQTPTKRLKTGTNRLELDSTRIKDWLIEEYERDCNGSSFFSEHTFVGYLCDTSVLLQHLTKLYLVDLGAAT